MSCVKKRIFNKEILASVHINFLFGAGVNGDALPQLNSFSDTKEKLQENGFYSDDGIEAAIDKIEDDNIRESVKKTFMDEFNEHHDKLSNAGNFFQKSSILNIEKLLQKVYHIVNEAQNRNASMKQINIYTLNYDTIVEKILAKLGYFYNAISASENSTKIGLLDVIGYNYKVNKYIPTYMVSKLHGDIKKPIVPGKSKYKEILNEDYFEIAFNMKEHLCKENSILIVIGYSGKDNHINKILEDCLNVGLTIYWYKYAKDDCVPFGDKINVIIREQDDYNEVKDTTVNCYQDMENIWDER